MVLLFQADLWHISYAELALRICLALLLGGIIGAEREWSNHAAGFRTHILVCIGSATVMLLSVYGFGQFAADPNVRLDPARLAAQAITGVGFLGAGAIMRKGDTVSGLTTAASLWVVMAIGLCVGAGFYFAAVLTAFLVLVSLYVLNKWERAFSGKRKRHELSIRVMERPDMLGQIAMKLAEHDIHMSHLVVSPERNEEEREGRMLKLLLSLRFNRPERLMQALDDISALDGVVSFEAPIVSAAAAGKQAARPAS
ncbi:MAG: MgtC/SapB family protein [Paenibacillaceae bacterium]|nr:MgtC/SapB family protein [Paenibacillaceae bacterium]